MDVALTEEESSALQQALRTYLSELQMEIADTDDHDFKNGLKHERTVLESVVGRLDATRGASEMRDGEGREVVRLVTLWWTEET